MWRRRLIFTVPPGDETHYWKIKGGKENTVGKVWAPLFHAYSYYLPKDKIPQRLWKRVDDNLTAASIGNLKHALMNMMFLAPMGPNRMIMNLLGSVGFAELESGFAYLDGNVSFGSSHTMGHTWGFGLVSLVLMLWRSSIRQNKWSTFCYFPFSRTQLPVLERFITNGTSTDIRSRTSNRLRRITRVGRAGSTELITWHTSVG